MGDVGGGRIPASALPDERLRRLLAHGHTEAANEVELPRMGLCAAELAAVSEYERHSQQYREHAVALHAGIVKGSGPVVVIVNSNAPANITAVVDTAFNNAAVPHP
jgi:hypothetical protein